MCISPRGKGDSLPPFEFSNITMSEKLLLFHGLLGITMGVGTACFAAYRKRLMTEAQQWPSTRGRVTASELLSGRGGTSIILYYEFAAPAMIIGRTPRMSGAQFRTEAEQRAFLDRFPKGSEVAVYFNPTNPKQNCLDRTDTSGFSVLRMLSILGFIYGGGSIVAQLFSIGT